VSNPWTEAKWRDGHRKLHKTISPDLERIGIKLDAQDLQNCLCEFDKYLRFKNGESTPKRLYGPKPKRSGKTNVDPVVAMDEQP
jgi:hypothetical protein